MADGAASGAGRGRTALLLAALAVAAYASIGGALLTIYPPVWPDEALFAAPAVDLLRHGRFGTPLLEGQLPGAGHTYWVPPLYPLAVAASFAVGGVGLVPLRLLGLLTGIVLLLVTFRLLRRLGVPATLAAGGVLLLGLNPAFVAGTLVGRMDALALLWLLLGLDAEIAAPPRPGRSGLFGALAVLTHPIGVVGVVAGLLFRAWDCRAARNLRPLVPWVAALAVPLLLAGVYVLGDPAAFRDQVAAQLQRKGARGPGSLLAAWRMTAHAGRVPLALLVPGLALGVAGLALAARRRHAVAALLLAVPLVVAVSVGAETWYPLYVAPFVAVGTVLLVARAAQRTRWLAAAVAALPLALLVVGAGGLAERVRRELRTESGGYEVLCRALARELPTGARVMVDAVPDPTLGLMARRDLALRSFSPVPTAAGRFAAVMAEMDYLVVSDRAPSDEPARWADGRGRLQAVLRDPRGWRLSVVRLRPPPGP